MVEWDRFHDEAVKGAEIVRSFMVTEGRTRAQGVPELPPETLISAGERSRSDVEELHFERRRVVTSHEGTCSIAEIAARERLPLRAAVIIVSELVAAEFLTAEEVVDVVGLPMLQKIREAIAAL